MFSASATSVHQHFAAQFIPWAAAATAATTSTTTTAATATAATTTTAAPEKISEKLSSASLGGPFKGVLSWILSS